MRRAKIDYATHPALTVACAKCGAGVGAPCTDYLGRQKQPCADRLPDTMAAAPLPALPGPPEGPAQRSFPFP